jgi:hypothetical protein
MVAIAEVKGVLPQAHVEHAGGQAHPAPPSVPYRQEEGAPA